MTGQMIESIMYFGIGFLLAGLSVLVVAPLVHGRAERLTMRRLEATIPLSMAEVQADKDLQRAEFAMSTRRLETKLEQLKTNSAGQLAELGRKGDAINRLKVELGTLRDQLSATEEQFAVKTRAALDAQRALSGKESELARLISELDERSSIANVQKVEIITLKAQVDAIKERLTATGKKVKPERGGVPLMPRVPMDSWQSAPPNNGHHAGDGVPLVPKDWPTAELLKVPMDSSQSWPPNDQSHEGDVVPPVPRKVGVVPLMPRAPMGLSQSAPNNRHREGDGVPLGPKDWPTAELLKVPMDSLQGPPPDDQSHEGGVVPLMPRAPMDPSQSAPNNRHHEGDGVPLGPKDWPTAELLKVPMDSSQSPPPNDQSHEGDVVPPVPNKIGVAPLMPKVRADSSPSPPRNDQRRDAHVVRIVPKDREEARPSGAAHDPIAGRDASDQIRTAREPSDFSAGLRSVESSIHVFPRPSGFKNDQFANDRSPIGRRPFRAVARLSIAALIGVGGLSAWQSHGDEAMEKIGTWVVSLGSLSSVSTTKSPPVPAPVAVATSPELAQQLEAMPRDLAVIRQNVEQLTEKHEQMARNIATLKAAEQHIKKKTSSPPLYEEKLTPWPETPPTTIPGWTLRGITNGTAVLEGPNGIWKAMRGDTVPGVGRVESMVRWGGRLIVATSSGLISTP
jgi:hypothetical protein